jgi:hypothetical protein
MILKVSVLMLIDLNRLSLFPVLFVLSITRLYCFNERMINGCGAIGGMRNGRGNRSTRRTHDPAPLCLRKMPHDMGSKPGAEPGTTHLGYDTSIVLSETEELLFLYFPDVHSSECVAVAISFWYFGLGERVRAEETRSVY